MSQTAKMSAKKPEQKKCLNPFKEYWPLAETFTFLYSGGASFGIAFIVLEKN